MVTMILALPRELSLQIIGQLSFHDKVRLSATCKEYRAYLVPEIFSTIRFTSQEGSANSALAAVESLGAYTTRIDFTCQAYSDEFSPSRLPPAATELLAGRHMPNLHTARLDFDFEIIPFPEFWFHLEAFAESGDDKARIRAAELSDWQAKECETWRALSMNQQIKALSVDNFNPATKFKFNTGNPRNFLARLEQVNLSVWKPLDDEFYGNIITHWNYFDFFKSRMDDKLFRHMNSLKHLEIWAPNTGPRGLDSQYRIGVGLTPGTLPALQSLKLVNGLITRDLISFIRDHSRSLSSLDVGECTAQVEVEQDWLTDGVSWAEFFDKIYEADPVLTRLVAGDLLVPPLAVGHEIPENVFGRDELRRIQEVQSQLKSQPSLKVFRYFYELDMSMYSVGYTWSMEQFRRGHDQRAYERLMWLVAKNAGLVRDE